MGAAAVGLARSTIIAAAAAAVAAELQALLILAQRMI
jgi:hypothetical protein